MNEHTTPSILQRVPVILAVTAASYGLPVQARGQWASSRTEHVAPRAATPSCHEPSARDSVTPQH